jgi:AcrR family transcriptional regulator
MVMRSSTLRNEIEARFPEVRDKLNEDDCDWTLMDRLVEWLRDFNAISADIVERLRRFKRWCEEQPRTEREDIWTSFIRGFWDNLFESNSTRVLIPQLMSRGEVTNEEILEAEKVIAHIRNDLTVLTSTTDVEKLVALVNERFERMICSFGRLRRRDWPNVFMSIQDLSRFQNGLAVMMALAEMAQRRPDYKAKLIDSVAKQAALVDAILDKVAQVIRALESTAH